MRLHRFFISEAIGSKSDLSIYDEAILHQWKNVFRLRAGEQVILLDNSGYECICTLDLLSKDKAEVKVGEKTLAKNIPEKEIWLYAALVKKDTFEWIIEKATELGVSHIIPVVSERSEKKDLNMERAHKILKEASEQSGRGMLPILHEVTDLEKAVAELSVPAVAFHLEGELFSSGKNSAQALFIGPEGGWTDKEIEFFREKNIPIYSLGNQVLRAETAAIVAVWPLLS